LAFVLERGLDSRQPAIKSPLQWISDPNNMPDANVWAATAYNNDAPIDLMEGLLTDKAAVFSSLLDDVEKSGKFGPPPDTFGERLNELQPLLGN
jgi:hypothetical protein